MDHRGDFEIVARRTLGEKVELAWGSPRLILLARSFNRCDQYAVNRIDERIELWTFTFYEGGFLGVDRVDSEELAPAPRKHQREERPAAAKKRRTDGTAYDLDHHLNKMGGEAQRLFRLLREEILALGDDVDERYMNQYVGYRRLRNFIEIVGLKSKLNLFIDGPVSDPHAIGQDVSDIGHWGTGNLRVQVTSDADVEQVMPIIRQAYQLQG